MPIAGSTYWNISHGLVAEDAKQDEEGMQTMRNLARNMVWMMRSFAVAKEQGVPYPTMAEFYMRHIVAKAGLSDSIYVESAATSREEIGNDTHYGTKQKLDEMGIPYTRRKARQVTVDDYHNFDYLIIMDENNRRNLKRIIGDDLDSKVFKAMSFVGESRDVKDPWYTGNFDETYDDVSRSCDALLALIKEKI